jgi:WD40 repeat protein
VSAGFDGTVTVWQTDGIPGARPVPGALDSGGWFSPDGSVLVTVGSQDTATVLRTSDFSLVANLSVNGAGMRDYNAGPTQAAFSPDGRRLALDSRDGYVQLFDAHSFSRIGAPIQVASTFLNGIAFSPDGKTLAVTSVGDNQGAWVIDVDTRETHALVPAAPRAVQPSFSPDGSELVVVGIGFGAVEYPIRGGAVSDGHQLDALGPDLVQAVFSPDGHTLALGTLEGAVRLVDSATLAPVAPPIKVASSLIAFIVFRPDGRLLITQDQRLRQLRIIDVEAGAPVGAPIEGNGQTYGWADFSPDGRTIVLPHAGGDILFDFDPATWSEAACSRANRTLTKDEWATYLQAAGNYTPTCRGT